MTKGFLMDDQRLKNPDGRPDYFDEMLARIRDIMASEKRFYQKVRDLFALCSDYASSDKATQMFFAETQNKLLYAVTGMTATEIIVNRADADKPNMALYSWKGSIVRKEDIFTAKNYPVLSLQVATWAFAKTGALDNTTFPNSGVKQMWIGKKLSDLPAMVLSHQITDGVEVGGVMTHDYDGSFFWRFDHTGGGSEPMGYTEEIVYGLLAISAMQDLNQVADYSENIAVSRSLLPVCVFPLENGKGEVYESPWFGYQSMNYYAGELLQAMAGLKIDGDLNDDGCVNLIDFAGLANKWLVNGCTSESWCDGADIDMDGHVNMDDFEIMANNWLVCYKLNN